MRTFIMVVPLSPTALASRMFPLTWTSATLPKATSDAVLFSLRTGRLAPFDQLEAHAKAVGFSTRAVAQVMSDEAEGDTGSCGPITFRDNERLRVVVGAPTAN